MIHRHRPSRCGAAAGFGRGFRGGLGRRLAQRRGGGPQAHAQNVHRALVLPADSGALPPAAEEAVPVPFQRGQAQPLDGAIDGVMTWGGIDDLVQGPVVVRACRVSGQAAARGLGVHGVVAEADEHVVYDPPVLAPLLPGHADVHAELGRRVHLEKAPQAREHVAGGEREDAHHGVHLHQHCRQGHPRLNTKLPPEGKLWHILPLVQRRGTNPEWTVLV
mmetsp:Transcript_89497/g.253589  ORF Transcript_89497/g.253589 Transcript_89497/m.253589 type:complete len:219 (+) Transcript_89497:144-800(+)